MRPSFALLSIPVLVACGNGGGGAGPDEGASGPSAPGVEWADPWTIGFVDSAASAPDAYFVRVVRATLSGDHDTFGDEEIVFSITSGTRRIQVAWVPFALSSGPHEVHASGAPWIELVPGESMSFTLAADDSDVLEYERIATADVRLGAGEFSTLEMERTVAGTGTSRFTFALVRAPRRTAADAEAREAARRSFGEYLDAPEPGDPGRAGDLAGRLELSARDAVGDAGRSLDTARREVLTSLARRAGRLAAEAKAYGKSAPGALAERRMKVRDAAARFQPARMTKGTPDEIRAAAIAIAERTAAEDSQGLELERAVSEIGTLLGRLEAEEKANPAFRRDAFALLTSLDDLRDGTVEARKGLERRTEVLRGWQELQRAIRAASGG